RVPVVVSIALQVRRRERDGERVGSRRGPVALHADVVIAVVIARCSESVREETRVRDVVVVIDSDERAAAVLRAEIDTYRVTDRCEELKQVVVVASADRTGDDGAILVVPKWDEASRDVVGAREIGEVR